MKCELCHREFVPYFGGMHNELIDGGLPFGKYLVLEARSEKIEMNSLAERFDEFMRCSYGLLVISFDCLKRVMVGRS